ncbi:unnamed protein product [Rhizopus microsporus]
MLLLLYYKCISFSCLSQTDIYAHSAWNHSFLVRLWFVLPRHDNLISKKRTGHCKTCIILGSGGHTTEMMQLVKGLDLTRYTPRCYVIADNDRLSEEKAIEYEQEMKKGTFFISKIPRARRVGQPIKTVPWTMLYSLFKSSQVFLNTLIPDLILCNGPGSCLPICILAYIPRILGIKKIDIIYIESFARVHSLSVTGKLLYPFADQFLVQWPELVSRYPKAIYQGVLV